MVYQGKDGLYFAGFEGNCWYDLTTNFHDYGSGDGMNITTDGKTLEVAVNHDYKLQSFTVANIEKVVDGVELSNVYPTIPFAGSISKGVSGVWFKDRYLYAF